MSFGGKHVLQAIVIFPAADSGEVILSSSWHPSRFDGVLKHLLISIEFRAM
jgi:hypothetical protein